MNAAHTPVWHQECMSLRGLRGTVEDLHAYIDGTADWNQKWRVEYNQKGRIERRNRDGGDR